MQVHSRILWVAIATLLSVAAPLQAQSPLPPSATIIHATTDVANQPGAMAPRFALKTLAGDTANLADYQGRPVLLNFWASWCTPCRGEMQDIMDAYESHKDRGLQVLAINLTDQERMRDVRRFVDELQMPFPVLLDQKGKVRKRYALRGVPTSVFIDAQGVVRVVHQGPITREAIQHGLAEILPAP